MAERRAALDAAALLDALWERMAPAARRQPVLVGVGDRSPAAMPARQTGAGLPWERFEPWAEGCLNGLHPEWLRPLVAWPFRKLPRTHWMQGGQHDGQPENPDGPWVAPSTTAPPHRPWADYPDPARTLRLAVVDLPSAPAEPAGTHALVVAVLVADLSAEQLDTQAAEQGIAVAKRWRKEASELRSYATSANARIPASLATWQAGVQQLLRATSEPFPTVPAQLRGFIQLGPTD